MTDIRIEVDARAAIAMLGMLPVTLSRALRAAMTDATVLLQREMMTYPPPPDPIQGPANVPVRRFKANYTTRSGQVAQRTVSIRANRMSGKGIRMAKADSLRYRRTNTLKSSWHRKITQGGGTISGEVVSSGQTAPYNIYVQSAERQARIHAGRWRTERQVADQNEAHIRGFFRDRVQGALR